MARALVDRGLAVLRFDFAGAGESGGEVHQATFSSNVADIRLAAVHLRKNFASRTCSPLLVLHSPNDEIVGIDNAAGIYAAAKDPKSFVSLDGADHLLTHPRHAKRAAQVIAAWADPYLPETFTPEID